MVLKDDTQGGCRDVPHLAKIIVADDGMVKQQSFIMRKHEPNVVQQAAYGYVFKLLFRVA
ncbi:hypothetical protein D3C73_1659420 [compost metagenome]